MTRMFTFAGKPMVVWNLFTGCDFRCSYCWARKLAESRLKRYYPNGFIPTTHPERFDRRFRPDDFVFPVSMGDISFALPIVFEIIINCAKEHPNTKFLLCTKDPASYMQVASYPPNIYLGTTIETTKGFTVGFAPSVRERYEAMLALKHPHKFISIEPIMDFDLFQFLDWMEILKPEIVEVGADNYKCNLPEPAPQEVASLLNRLKHICPTVIEKKGLERLL